MNNVTRELLKVIEGCIDKTKDRRCYLTLELEHDFKAYGGNDFDVVSFLEQNGFRVSELDGKKVISRVYSAQ